MKRTARLVTFFIVAASPILRAQPAGSIGRAALNHLRSDLPKGRIVIDDVTFGPRPRSLSKAEKREFAAGIPGSVVEPGKPHMICVQWNNPSTCHVDVDAVVSVGHPRIASDTAAVELSVQTNTGLQRVPTQRLDYRVRLVRRGATWVVIDRVVIAVT